MLIFVVVDIQAGPVIPNFYPAFVFINEFKYL